jgi:hypothetical protein
MNEHYMETGDAAERRKSILERLGRERLGEEIEAVQQPPSVADMQAVVQETTEHRSQRRADAINAMLRAKGVQIEFSALEADKLWYIAETLESITS